MLSLRQRTNWTHKPRKLGPGELVGILKDITPRGFWPVRRIIKPLNCNLSEQIRKHDVKSIKGKRTMVTVQVAPVFDASNAIYLHI